MTKSAKAAADWVLLTRKSAKKVAANGHIRPETRKIPRSEEQGNDLESLDFPVSAHPNASTVLGCARRLHAIAVACRTLVRPSEISAWRIKQEQLFSHVKTAQSQ